MICLVTDRRRLSASDSPSVQGACLVEQIRYAVEAGVDLVQVRERDLGGGALVDLVSSLLSITKGSGTRLVVNDRLDVALACGADGVHLRGDSIAVRDARRLGGSGFLIGRSVRDADSAIAAADADYLIAGTMFRSNSKPSAVRWLGVQGLAEIVRAVPIPVLAIGGITAVHLDDVAAARAAGVAAIGLFMEADPDAPAGDRHRCRVMRLRELMTRLRQQFDSVHTRP